MKKIFCAVAMVVLLAGCMSIRKTNDVVSNRYKYIKGIQPNSSFEISNQIEGGKVAETQKVKSVAIPALFYWKFSKTYRTQMHTVVPLNLFSKYSDDYARTMKFSDQLGNRKILLDVVSIPNAFEATFSNQTIYLLLAAAYSTSNFANMESTGLKVEYKIVDNGQTTDSGMIEVTEADLQKYSAQFSVSKKSNAEPKIFLTNYLDVYENIIYLDSRIFVDKLLLKLTGHADEN